MTRPGRPGIPQSVMLVSHLPDEIPSNDTVDQDPPERQEHVEYEAGDRDRRCRLDKVELAQHDHDDDLRHLQAPRAGVGRSAAQGCVQAWCYIFEENDASRAAAVDDFVERTVVEAAGTTAALTPHRDSNNRP